MCQLLGMNSHLPASLTLSFTLLNIDYVLHVR
jgi:hypothetical protein